MKNMTVPSASCGIYKSGSGFSFDDWKFYDNTVLTNCRAKDCNDDGQGDGWLFKQFYSGSRLM
jgi:hypothetical protein